jgi:hypothetical protein
MLKLKRQRGSEYSLETELVIRKSTAPARKRKLRLEQAKLESLASARKSR